MTRQESKLFLGLGLRTAEDYRFYTISKALPEDFSNKGKNLVFQFSVKHEQTLDCGGGYLKILPSGLDQENFNGDSKYKYVVHLLSAIFCL